MKVLLIGGTGMVGTSIVKALLDDSSRHKVTLVTRNPKKIKGLIGHPQIKFIKNDLPKDGVKQRWFTGQDAVIHIAVFWREGVLGVLESDTMTTVKLIDHSLKAGVKQFIYTSSVASLGAIRDSMPEDTYTIARELYGATKLASENFLMATGGITKMRCNAVRPGYIFADPAVEGAPMEGETTFLDIVKKARANKPIKMIKNDGTQYIAAADLAKLYLAILKSKVNMRIYNALAKKYITKERIAKKAIQLLGSKSKIIMDDQGWVVRDTYVVARMKEDFGLEFYSWPRVVKHIERIIEATK